MWDTSSNFQAAAQSKKKSLFGRKFAQSGHPASAEESEQRA
jgi:hypothetical protein